MTKKKRGLERMEVAVRDLIGDFKLGIDNLSLLLAFERYPSDPRFIIELVDGISDRDAVTALTALIEHIRDEGLPRFAVEEEAECDVSWH